MLARNVIYVTHHEGPERFVLADHLGKKRELVPGRREECRDGLGEPFVNRAIIALGEALEVFVKSTPRRAYLGDRSVSLGRALGPSGDFRGPCDQAQNAGHERGAARKPDCP